MFFQVGRDILRATVPLCRHAIRPKPMSMPASMPPISGRSESFRYGGRLAVTGKRRRVLIYKVDALRMVKFQGKVIGLPESICCLIFRAMRIMACLARKRGNDRASAGHCRAPLPADHQALRPHLGCAHLGGNRKRRDLIIFQAHLELSENFRRTRRRAPGSRGSVHEVYASKRPG